MLAVGRDVCSGFEIGVDVDQLLENGARYRDKRPMAQQMWTMVMKALQAINAGKRKCRHEHTRALRHPPRKT
jgi:hypothetical protein